MYAAIKTDEYLKRVHCSWEKKWTSDRNGAKDTVLSAALSMKKHKIEGMQ
jgi:hypothetical protein